MERKEIIRLLNTEIEHKRGRAERLMTEIRILNDEIGYLTAQKKELEY